MEVIMRAVMILHWWFPILKSTGYKFEFFSAEFPAIVHHITSQTNMFPQCESWWPDLFSLQFLQKATESVPSHSFPWVIRRKLTCSSASAAKSTVSDRQLWVCRSVLMFTMKLNVLPFFWSPLNLQKFQTFRNPALGGVLVFQSLWYEEVETATTGESLWSHYHMMWGLSLHHMESNNISCIT